MARGEAPSGLPFVNSPLTREGLALAVSCASVMFWSLPNFCSCLICQAQLPNLLGNYIFQQPLVGDIVHDVMLSLWDEGTLSF